MNPIVRTIFRSNVGAFLIFAVILCGANWLLAKGSIPAKPILFVAVLFAVYYNFVFKIAVYTLSGKRKKWIIAFCSLILLVLTTDPILGFLIYSFFPILGVYLDQNMLMENYMYDRIEFRRRWVSALTFIIFLVGLRLVFRLYKSKMREANESKQQTKRLEQEITNLNRLLKARNLNPHFMVNVSAIALHRERMRPNEENMKMLTMLIALMNYQLRMDNDQQTTHWQDEWEQVENLLEMACYKDQNFVYEWRDSNCLADLDTVIPHGLLLMPLENALKYGKNTAKWPLRMVFRKSGDRIHIRYTNYFDPLKRDQIQSTHQGFPLMEARLGGGAWPITMLRQEEGDCFWVDIEIICSTSTTYDDEERKVYDPHDRRSAGIDRSYRDNPKTASKCGRKN